MTTVSASLVVNFGGSSGASSANHAVLELDDVLNEGETSFKPGDNIHLVFQYDAATLRFDRIAASDGQLVPEGADVRERSDQYEWASNEDEQTLQYVPEGSISVQSFGNSVTIHRQVMAITSEGSYPAVTRLTYNTDFLLYRLIAPDMILEENEDYPITVVAFMSEI